MTIAIAGRSEGSRRPYRDILGGFSTRHRRIVLAALLGTFVAFAIGQTSFAQVAIPSPDIPALVTEPEPPVTQPAPEPQPVPVPEPEPSPPSPQDDIFDVEAGRPIDLDILRNDIDIASPPPDIALTSQPACGRATVSAANVLLESPATCEGQDSFRYSLGGGSGEAEVRINYRADPAKWCNGLDAGLEMIYIPGGEVEPVALTSAREPTLRSLADAMREARGDEPVTVPSFCIMRQELLADRISAPAPEPEIATCLSREIRSPRGNLAHAVTDAAARSAADGLGTAKWNVSLPGLAEIARALDVLSEDASRRDDFLALRTSLRAGLREWTSESCGDGKAMMIGPRCNLSFSAECYATDREAGLLGGVGIRFVARPR